MRTLYQSKHARLEIDDTLGLVRYTRSGEPFESLSEVEALFRQLASANATIDRTNLVLLSDVRAAPGRNDEAFEKAFFTHREALFGGFRRRAVLVRSVVGKLQVQRLSRTSPMEMQTFDDEAAALAFLTSR
jgi:hypothetical protein